MPARLTRPFTSAVAVISRRSGWSSDAVEERSRTAVGKERTSSGRKSGSSGSVAARAASSSSVILAYASSTASSGAVSPRPAACRSPSSSSVGSRSTSRSRSPARFERADEPGVHLLHLGRLRVRVVERAVLAVVVAQHERRDLVGHAREQRVAVVDGRARRPRTAPSSRILMLTSWSEVSTPALLSIASVLMRPPASAYSTRPSLREAEVAAFGDDRAAQLAPVDAHRVVRLVADVGVASRCAP